MCLCAHGSDLSGCSLCFPLGVCVCMPECVLTSGKQSAFHCLFMPVCMRCCSASSELSQEEIENPGPGSVHVLLHSEEAATPTCMCESRHLCWGWQEPQLLWTYPQGNGHTREPPALKQDRYEYPAGPFSK